MSERKRGGFLSGFFLGALLGGVMVFFLGTKEGRKLAKHFLKKGEEMANELEKRLKELEKEGKKVVKKAEKVGEEVMRKIEKKERQAREKIGEAITKIEDFQEKGLQKTAEIRRFFTRNGRKLTSIPRSD